MQTPPPSSTTTARKRGRPPKKAFQNPANSTSQVLSPPQTSPTKVNGGDGQTLDMMNNKSILQAPVPDLRISAFLPETLDEYLSKEHAWNRGLGYGGGLGVVGTEGESTDPYDWSSMRANVSDVSIEGLDVLGHLRRDGQSSPLYDDPSGPIHFSFGDDLLGVTLPLDVDPNLIFSSTATSVASSLPADENKESVALGTASQPYQHQHLQHLREQELVLQKQQLEKSTKDRLRGDRTVNVSGGRVTGNHRAPLKHSMSDSLLSGPARRPTTKAADFDAAVTKRGIRKGAIEMRSTALPPRASMNDLLVRARGFDPISAKLPRMRTEVKLAISPGGRAKTETTVVYENPEAETDEGPIGTTSDSYEESDSSLDDEEPRGLGPDGREYMGFRDPGRTAFSARGRPVLHRRSGTMFEKRTPVLQPPRTPTRRSHAQLVSLTSKELKGLTAGTAATTTITSARLDSSPRLPTPLKSSPPVSIGRHLRENVRRASGSSYSSSRALSMMGTPTLGSMHEVSDESEAETVVDGTEILSLREQNEEEDGDAMAALRKVMRERRRSEGETASLLRLVFVVNRGLVIAPIEWTPTKSRPGSAAKPQFFSSGSTTAQRSITRHSQVHPGLLLQSSAVKKKLFADETSSNGGRRRKVADGGFPEGTHSIMAPPDAHCSATVKRRTKSTRRKPESMPPLEGGATRCICKRTSEQGGTTMVQWYVWSSPLQG